ncbi:MAG: hypothetical protein AABY53_05810 [Bdellovibrionota bacterium]
MNITMIVGQVILYSVLIGLGLWGIKHGVSLYIFSRKKETINKLNARISILKLHLKGKIKRKCNKIADVFNKEDPETLRMLQPKLNTIGALSFNSAADYQNLIKELSAITQDISGYIKIKHKVLLKQQEAQAKAEEEVKEPPTEEEKIAESCKKLVKYDKAHMLIVVEVIQATTQLIEKITEYNAFVEYEKNQKKITEIPEKIEIENYEVIAALVEQAKTSNIESPDFQILGRDQFKDAA